jgi:hypothetical protein
MRNRQQDYIRRSPPRAPSPQARQPRMQPQSRIPGAGHSRKRRTSGVRQTRTNPRPRDWHGKVHAASPERHFQRLCRASWEQNEEFGGDSCDLIIGRVSKSEFRIILNFNILQVILIHTILIGLTRSFVLIRSPVAANAPTTSSVAKTSAIGLMRELLPTNIPNSAPLSPLGPEPLGGEPLSKALSVSPNLGAPERNTYLREAAGRLSEALFQVVHQPTAKGRDRSLAALVALIYGPTPFGGVNSLRDVAMRYGMSEQNLFQLMRVHRDLLARTVDPEYEI